jgi:hypothetical protein
MTDLEASEIVEILEAAYPTWPLTKKTVGLYASVLVELDFDVAKDVVTEIIKSGREFAPPVGLIHSRLAADLRKISSGSFLAHLSTTH